MIQTPFNYTGNKFRLLSQIIPHFDYSKDIFIDLFAGGGSVYTNVVNKYKKVIVNDIIADLIDIHRELLYSDDIVDEVKSLVVDKDDQEGYIKLRTDYNNNPTPAKLWALMLCCTNNMLRFNKSFKFNQTFGKRSYNPNTEKKIIEFTNHIRKYKDKIIYHSEHFKDIRYKNSMIYIDPPYSNTEAGYNAYWNKDDDLLLHKYIKIANKNNCSFMVSGIYGREKESRLINLLLDDGFDHKLLNFDYKGVSRNKSKKQGNEIIIFNYNA